ncbi:MAG TPA: hypothetical protein VHM92_08550 [Allosphingosinicella sp.]|nr:hypothetical protein [Allosphingosinicella sp.]
MIIRDPNEVREELAAPAAAPAVGGAAGKRDAVLANITASYFFLRRGLAFLALAFPFALWALAGINDSLSAYYHCTGGVCAARGGGAGRDVLTGVLLATGTFLFFYKGYTRKEDWALNLAGIAAAAVAFFPSDFARVEGRSLIGKIHFIGGLVFFLAIAFVCLVCSGDTLKTLKDEAKLRWFKRRYAALGTAMIAVPIGVFALHYLLERPGRGYTVLGVELAGLFVFAAFWLYKSKEIALIERQ